MYQPHQKSSKTSDEEDDDLISHQQHLLDLKKR
jgi:hypothetical protein